jgi:cell filamentation protein, protein adenylyltransferase
MNPNPRRAGQRIRCPGGYHAFVPAPLPLSIEFTPELVRALSEADRKIGELSGEGRRLPNPHLLMRPFLTQEAVLSSRIEGTQATLGELLAVEAGAAVDRSPDDLRETANYVVALEHGIDRLPDLPLSLRLVRELHGKLLACVRGETATPGEFRRSQNWIGPPGCTLQDATFVPPPPHLIVGVLGDWETFLHDRSLPPLIQVGLAHYQFEAIHPFLDGNGRIGRLLITLFLIERGILPTPLLYLSAFFEATRAEYYERLRMVSEESAWEEWLCYFLRGVARMAADALHRSERINALLATWRNAVAGSSTKNPTRLVELLAENPFWSINKAATRLGVAFTTAQRTIERLEAAGILQQSGGAKRDRVYCATELMKILDEPPRF